MKNESPEQKINDLNIPKCLKGNPTTIVCSSQHCTNKAFVCNDDKCDCRASHKFCFQILISSIMRIIQGHSFSLEPLAKQIETLFDNAIDKLSDQRDKILKQMQIQDKYQYLGLTQLERKFVDVVRQGVQDYEINCKLIYKLQYQSKAQNRVNSNFSRGEKLIEKLKSNLKQQYIDYTNNLRQFLQGIKRQQYLTGIFSKSAIIKSGQDQDKLLAFFTQKKVQSANLLYRASQNEFSTIKWYQKCGKIANTLTIVETEFGKVIGGFTSFQWVRNGQWISAVNDIKNHFLFSLTNNDIFTITNNYPQYCIYGYPDNSYGPRFGYNYALQIRDKANQNNKSRANIGNTFTNTKYIYGDLNSQKNFGGSDSFKIKQWQVWEIKFNA